MRVSGKNPGISSAIIVMSASGAPHQLISMEHAPSSTTCTHPAAPGAAADAAGRAGRRQHHHQQHMQLQAGASRGTRTRALPIATGLLRGLLGLLAALLLAWRAPTLAEQGGAAVSDALWRGMERSRAAHQLGRDSRRSQQHNDGDVQAQWKAAKEMFEKGLVLFEAQNPTLPWDPVKSPGPQLLFEAARALYYLRQPQAALKTLERLEAVLPAGDDIELHGVVQQWAFRSHTLAHDYAGHNARLRRLLRRHGLKEDLETVAAANLRRAWRNLSLPQDIQLQAAQALSRDVGGTHPRSAVRVWQLLQESSLLPWSAVQRRAAGGDIGTAGREHWVLFITSLHRCMGLPDTSVATQQHRAACNDLLVRHWKELRRFGSWVHPAQFPLAFDPSLAPEPMSATRHTGWLNSSDAVLRPCAMLAEHTFTIQQEWAAFIKKSSYTSNDSKNGTESDEDWPQLTARHADSQLTADSKWEMLYLRRGNGSGGFLAPVCGDGDPSGNGHDVPFSKTCALLSSLKEVSWGLQRLPLRSMLKLLSWMVHIDAVMMVPSLQATHWVEMYIGCHCHTNGKLSRYYPCGAVNTTGAVDARSQASSLCVPPGTPNFFDSPGPVAFLRLKNGGSVPPHVGTTNLRLKCHLALEVPRDALGPISTTATVDGPISRESFGEPRSRYDGVVHAGTNIDSTGQRRGAWVEVGGSDSFPVRVPMSQQGPKSDSMHQQTVVTWDAPGQVEAFDDSFIHAVGNNGYWYPFAAGDDDDMSGGSRTVLEVSFWHPLLRTEGWLLPSSYMARRGLILGSVRRVQSGTTAVVDPAEARSHDSRGRFLRIEVDYNGLWNRGEIVQVDEPGDDVKLSSAGPVDESKRLLLVFVEYDRSQKEQQCSDEWLLLDCELMRWSQPGYGSGGFRIRPGAA